MPLSPRSHSAWNTSQSRPSSDRCSTADRGGLGTALLLYIIVGSGIAAETLGTDPGTRLLAQAIVVGLGLGALIVLFQNVSGSHFNPSVTLGLWRIGALTGDEAARYVAVQLAGAVVGVLVANLSASRAIITFSHNARDGIGPIVPEGIATFVLVLVVLALGRIGRRNTVPMAVGAWVTAIVFATPSTGFANPAVTIARVFTDSYTGIAPSSVIGFLAAQLLAGITAAPVAFFSIPIRSRFRPRP